MSDNPDQQQWLQSMAALVHAAGGKITVTPRSQQMVDQLRLTAWQDPKTQGTVYMVELIEPAPMVQVDPISGEAVG